MEILEFKIPGFSFTHALNLVVLNITTETLVGKLTFQVVSKWHCVKFPRVIRFPFKWSSAVLPIDGHFKLPGMQMYNSFQKKKVKCEMAWMPARCFLNISLIRTVAAAHICMYAFAICLFTLTSPGQRMLALPKYLIINYKVVFL